MRSIGLPELLIVLGIAVLLFGGRKIPEVAKGLGEGIKNFKKGITDEDDEDEEGKEPKQLPPKSKVASEEVEDSKKQA
jgi:sec-independent protein translocase protein TatA